MVNVLYLCDLFTSKARIVSCFKKYNIKKIKVIDFINVELDTNDPAKIIKQKIINEINKLKSPTIMILDSLIVFFIALIYHDGFDFRNIKKIVIINPFAKSFYYKIFTIKNILLPKNSRTMVYKKIYLFNKLSEFTSNDLFIKDMRSEMNYLVDNEHKVNLILNQILNFKSLKKYFNFLENNQISIIYGEKNKILTNNDLKYLNKFKDSHLINESCYYHFWESPKQIIDVILEISK